MIKRAEVFFYPYVKPRQETIDEVLEATDLLKYRQIWWRSFIKEALSIPPGLKDQDIPLQDAQVRRKWRRGFVAMYNVLAVTFIPIAPVVTGGMLAIEAAWLGSNPQRAMNTADASVEQAVQRRTSPQ